MVLMALSRDQPEDAVHPHPIGYIVILKSLKNKKNSVLGKIETYVSPTRTKRFYDARNMCSIQSSAVT